MSDPREARPPVATTTPVPVATIELALSDATTRTGQTRDAITVLTAERVTWGDGSLGCPQPGALYTQALVPGYRIVLQVAEQTMQYHAALKGPPRFCPASRAVPPVLGRIGAGTI